MTRLRLEYRLPLLVSGIFIILAMAGTWLAYREIRGVALSSAEDRIDAVSAELAPLVAGMLQQRGGLLQRAVDVPLVRAAAVPGVAVPVDSLAAALAFLRGGEDVPFLAAVLRADGTTIEVGRVDGVRPPPPEALLGFDGADGFRYSRLFAAGGQAFYWVGVPFGAGGPAGAMLVQLRVVGASARLFADLAGTDAAIYVVNADAGNWFTLGNGPVEAPANISAIHTPFDYVRNGRAYLAREREIAGTPWRLIIELPHDVAFSRANLFVRRVGAIGLLLTLIGAGASVLVVRRLLRPIRAFGDAARGIASGEYGRRVHVHGDDEIGELADSFNAMASQVGLAIDEAKHSQMQADEANRAKSAFLATMSHELRTPINAVLGYTELLDLGLAGDVADEQRSYLDRIRASSQHLTRLVDEILDFATIEAGELRVAPALCQAAEHVRAACDVIVPQARVRRVNLVVESSNVAFVGDPQRVEQILVNLLSNAVKFTAAGGTVRIGCTLAEAPSALGGDRVCRFDVVDTGCGIPAELHEAIFEPFVQVDASYTRAHGGAGLGLSISRELARLMGGAITLSSSTGQGSTFTLWLPVSPVAPVRHAIPGASPAVADAGAEARRGAPAQ